MVLTESTINKVESDTLNKLKALFKYGAVGTDGNSDSTDDTSLGNEVFREAVSESNISGSQFIASIFIGTSEANGYNLVEAGFFDKSSGGTLLFRDLFNETLKTDDINIYIDGKIPVNITQS